MTCEANPFTGFTPQEPQLTQNSQVCTASALIGIEPTVVQNESSCGSTTRVVPGAWKWPREAPLAGWAATGSIWRLADSQHGSDQVVQRPGQVLFGDQDNLVIDAKMVDRLSRNRAVGRHGG
jgi:hypothetical protein